jgi:hypothetical protein
MNIKSSITIPVDKGIAELNKALHTSCLQLLELLGENGQDIKLEHPIPLTSSKMRGKYHEVDIKCAIARYISYVSPYDPEKPESGFYLLYEEKGGEMICYNGYLSLENKVKVYEELKSMVRHKKA